MKRFIRAAAMFMAAIMLIAVAVPAEVQAASYSLKISGYSRKPGDKVGKIVKKWKVKEMSRTGSCISESGEDVIYFKSGLTVKATSQKKGGAEKITEISITKKKYKTAKGIRVGDSLDRLEKKFSNLKKQGVTGSAYYVKKGKTKITYYIEDDKIGAISYTKG